MTISRGRPRWVPLTALLGVVVVAAVLRVYRLPSLPLGLHYDEAANGILAGEIARGLRTPIFIASYTGKEVLFFYWTALWMKLLGVTPLALRLGAASIGAATVAATAWAAYELFHWRRDARWIALVSAAFLAVSFWHLLLSRYGFRAITQPLFQALTVGALWRGLRIGRPGHSGGPRPAWLLLAGLFCGLTAYTYLAARAFPVPLAAALLTLIVADRRRPRLRAAQAAGFVAAAAVILAPLAYYWLTHPGSFLTRTRQVVAGSWTEVSDGLLACLKMFFLEGDPYVRFNVPGRPLLGPAVAALFLFGLGACVRDLIRLPRASADEHRPLALSTDVFLLVWLPVMLLPSALATGEITPSNLRAVGLLPFLYAYPAFGVVLAVGWIRERLAPGSRWPRFAVAAVGMVAVGASAASVASVYTRWASSPTVYEAADGDLVDAARYLNRMSGSAGLSSVTPYVASEHYRHPTVAFLADDYDQIRWLVGGQTLVYPPRGEALALFPRSASHELDWVRSRVPQGSLREGPPGPDGQPGFHVYRGSIREAPPAANRRTDNFGQVARLLGYTVVNTPRAGQPVTIDVWWQVTGSPDQPDYRSVARLADPWGSIWGGREPFHYPSEQWTEGELIVDHLTIPVAPGAPPGDYFVRCGLYAPGADARLPLLDDDGAYAGLYARLPVQVARAVTPVPEETLGIERALDVAVDGLSLLGVRVETTTLRPGERLRSVLFWQAQEASLPPYELSLRLGDTMLYQGAPVHDTYPFSEWVPGEVVADRYDPRLPLDVSPGTHPLTLHVADRQTAELSKITVRAPERTFEVPLLQHRLGVTFGERAELVGYDLSSDSVAPGGTLALTLTWRAAAEMTTNYTVFTHLVAPDGSIGGQEDREPVGGTYPTSLWAPGEVVTDTYMIPVRGAAPPGAYRLEVGMYLPETGTRLPTDGRAGDAVTLQTISVGD